MQEKTDTTMGQSSRPRQNGPDLDPGSFIGRNAGSAGGSAPQGARSTADPSTGSPKNEAKDKLSDAASRAGDQVASRLDTQKTRAAEGLGSVAQALRQASDQLRGQNDGAAAGEYVASAASQVERLSGYLRSTNTREMINGVERFARQQPAIFVGGAFMLGLLGARFLKSSDTSGSYRSGSVQRDPARPGGEGA